MKRRRPSDLIRGLVDRRMLIKERVRSARVLRPVGDKREVVFDEECATPALVSTTTPGASSSPGSQISVLGPRGSGQRIAIEAVVTGRNVGSEAQGHTLPALTPACPCNSPTYFTASNAQDMWDDLAGTDGVDFVSANMTAFTIGFVDIQEDLGGGDVRAWTIIETLGVGQVTVAGPGTPTINEAHSLTDAESSACADYLRDFIALYGL